jgi:hypothetical protein
MRLATSGIVFLALVSACKRSEVSPGRGPTATATSTAISTATPTSNSSAAKTNAPKPPVRGPAGRPRTFKLYVAGESIEARNRYLAAPFTSAGTLDNHGADPNRSDEFGWMVPFAEHLKWRDGGISIEWVGSEKWVGVDDAEYSGTYPTKIAPKTSAISATTIPAWLSWPGNDDLSKKLHCYDVAICARGGNDFPNANDAEYKEQLKTLIRMLHRGSSCRDRPLILVTSHIPDDRQEAMPLAEFVAAQTHRYKTRVEQALAELRKSDPQIHIRYIDLFSAFRENWPTTAFPEPRWFVGSNWDFAKIHRDGLHPRRLASIYAGEVAANAIDVAELRALP